MKAFREIVSAEPINPGTLAVDAMMAGDADRERRTLTPARHGSRVRLSVRCTESSHIDILVITGSR